MKRRPATDRLHSHPLYPHKHTPHKEANVLCIPPPPHKRAKLPSFMPISIGVSQLIYFSFASPNAIPTESAMATAVLSSTNLGLMTNPNTTSSNEDTKSGKLWHNGYLETDCEAEWTSTKTHLIQTHAIVGKWRYKKRNCRAGISLSSVLKGSEVQRSAKTTSISHLCIFGLTDLCPNSVCPLTYQYAVCISSGCPLCIVAYSFGEAYTTYWTKG